MYCEICGQRIEKGEAFSILCSECESKLELFKAYELEITFCRYCIYGTLSDYSEKVECHRHAPSVNSNILKGNKWPVLEKSDWCGEGKKR